MLPGVTRKVVLHNARLAEIDTQEGSYSLDALKDIDAAFITNASIGIIPVGSIEGETVQIHASSESHSIVTKLIDLLALAQNRDLLLL